MSVSMVNSQIFYLFYLVFLRAVYLALLFLVYINDLPTSVSNSSVLIFAGDTKCYSGISSMQESTLLQQDLDAIENWSKSWKLHFNESKFVKLSINVTSNHLPTKYTCNWKYSYL